ncbi:hypothetical protein [Halalkalicoccus jeotgali]|uniref:Uncharacterized protein n=1 Tax=Halalkalicoccus jeotgali (strain DSM 18796 / CECT 7217 / JCM 14584 / KCTC 4019 / B3) TaxID=795797 RepID=D8JAA3_HALJB|nr:hypothetical protein [Halalkalicoccus jeotgali]ADJ14625.1 hypothetical protein HacjB3_06170 [Halalkalicoccus jeotgali B3]ELY39524.1 hypothetical protein C497_04562 [Halalkalicoccus jeotgali B3]
MTGSRTNTVGAHREDMTIELDEAIDEAQYVAVSADRRLMAVWYGAQTVTVFLIEDPAAIAVVESVPIGEYRFGETSREDARETIESIFEEYRHDARDGGR